MEIQRYNKLIAAIVGLAVLAATNYGIDLAAKESVILDAVISLATAFGIYQAKNKEAA